MLGCELMHWGVSGKCAILQLLCRQTVALEEGGCLGSWAICAILRDFVIVGLQTEVLELLRVSGDCAIHEPDPRTIHLDSSKHVYTVLRTPSVPFKYLPSQRHGSP